MSKMTDLERAVVYRDGFQEITRDEFFALQDRLCAGDPVALAYVLIQQRRSRLARAAQGRAG